jgi:hypothetical protein
MDRFFLFLIFFGSVEIPDLTSLPEIHDEPVFDGYRKGGCLSCQMAGQIRENGQKTVFNVPKWRESIRRFPDGNLLKFALP